MPKWIKIGMGFVIIVVVALVSLRLYINYILKTVIYQQVESFSNNNYVLKLDKIEVGALAFNASIDGFSLTPKNESKNKNFIKANIKAKSIKLRGLSLFNLIFYKAITLNRLELVNPKINLILNQAQSEHKFKMDSLIYLLKINKLIFSQVEIVVNNGLSSMTTLNAKSILYDIKNLKLSMNSFKFQTTDSEQIMHCVLNKGLIRGFNLDELLNDRQLNYSAAELDYLKLSIFKKTTETILNQKVNNLHQAVQNKFFKSFKPLNIQKLDFKYKNDDKTILAIARKLSYSKRDFVINKINLRISNKDTFQFISKRINAKGFDADSIAAGYVISINDIEILEPSIQINLTSGNNKQIVHKDSIQSLINLFYIRKINNLKIINAQYKQIDHCSSLKIAVKNVNISIKNIYPNIRNDKLPIQFQKAQINGEELSINLPNNLYRITCSKLNYSQSIGNAFLNNFKLIPNYSKHSFPRIVGKQRARVTMTVNKMELTKFDLQKLLANEAFECDQLNLKKADIYFYKDKNIPIPPEDYRKFPQELLMQAPFGLKSQRLSLSDGHFFIEILPEKGTKTGTFEIDEVNLQIKNIDNRNKSASNIASLTFSGRLAKIGEITAQVSFPVNDKLCNHLASIQINQMPFEKLNTLISSMMPVSFNKGILRKAKIQIKGNKLKTQSSLEMTYNDLSIILLKDATKNDKYRKLMLGNNLANLFIINDNPSAGKSVRTSLEIVPTESNKFILNNWLSTTLNAMLSTITPNAANFIKRQKTK